MERGELFKQTLSNKQRKNIDFKASKLLSKLFNFYAYESFATVGEIRVYRRADFQSGSRVLKKVF